MKYRVIVKETESYAINVDADSEREAMNKADEILDNTEDRGLYHNDSSSESEAFPT